MRVFLDTNVLVSAFTTRGLCHDLFRLILAEHDFLCGELVLEELVQVLRERFKVPASVVKDITRLLRSYPVSARPETVPDIPVRAPDDARVLGSALAAKADILVTGNKDLLGLPAVPNLRITDPRGFWSIARKTP